MARRPAVARLIELCEHQVAVRRERDGDLGTNWSITLEVREQHRLISHGVYRRIRHPMYSECREEGPSRGDAFVGIQMDSHHLSMLAGPQTLHEEIYLQSLRRRGSLLD